MEVVTLVAPPELTVWGRVELGVERIYTCSAVTSREGVAWWQSWGDRRQKAANYKADTNPYSNMLKMEEGS